MYKYAQTHTHTLKKARDSTPSRQPPPLLSQSPQPPASPPFKSLLEQGVGGGGSLSYKWV